MTDNTMSQIVEQLAVQMFNETEEVHRNLLVLTYTDDRGVERYQAFMRGAIFYYRPEGIQGNLGYKDSISGVTVGSGTTFLRLDTVTNAEIKPYQEVIDTFQYNNYAVDTAKAMAEKKAAEDAAKTNPVIEADPEPVVEE